MRLVSQLLLHTFLDKENAVLESVMSFILSIIHCQSLIPVEKKV